MFLELGSIFWPCYGAPTDILSLILVDEFFGFEGVSSSSAAMRICFSSGLIWATSFLLVTYFSSTYLALSSFCC